MRPLLAVATTVGVLASVVVLSVGYPPRPGSASSRIGGGSDPVAAHELATTGTNPVTVRSIAVQRLLNDWSAAVRTNDPVALATLVDPSADEGFGAAETRRAANLVGVPLASWGYEIGTDAAPVVPPALVQRLSADEVWAPPVVLRYAVAGVDGTATRKPVGLVLARRGDVWRLVGDTDLTRFGRTTWRGPWDFGPILARTTAQGVVLAHPGHEVDLDRVAAELVTAVPAVTSLWGPDWGQQALVLLAASQLELEAEVGTALSGVGIAAITTADAVDRVAGTATGVRVVVNPAAMAQLTPATLRVVLRHELTHVAARPVTMDQAPRWMLEGFADYVGYRGAVASTNQDAPAVAALVRTTGVPDRLPRDSEFVPSGDSSRAELAYQLSWTFASFLAETRGEAALRAAYRAVAARAAPTPAQLDAELGASLGANQAQLVAAWGRWLIAAVG